jgi:hypothetical protein
MTTKVQDFVGSWVIRWVKGDGPFREGWFLVVGEPITVDDQIHVPFEILDHAGNVQPVEEPAQGPTLAQYTGETLRWDGFYEDKPLRLFASLAQVDSFKSIYGATIFGDPDQVGVWGGGAGTPPDPPGV